MLEKELKILENEIVRQMEVKDINEGIIKGDWSKVDPAIRDAFVKITASRMVKTMENLGPSLPTEQLTNISGNTYITVHN